MKRFGFSAVWVLVTLSVLTILSAIITKGLLARRGELILHDHRVQCEELARSGIELGIDRLLKEPKAFQEEFTPIPNSKVKVVAEAEGKGFRIQVEASWTDERKTYLEKMSRKVAVTTEKGKRQAVVVAD